MRPLQLLITFPTPSAYSVLYSIVLPGSISFPAFLHLSDISLPRPTAHFLVVSKTQKENIQNLPRMPFGSLLNILASVGVENDFQVANKSLASLDVQNDYQPATNKK